MPVCQRTSSGLTADHLLVVILHGWSKNGLVCLLTHPSSTWARRRVTSSSNSRSPGWNDVVRRAKTGRRSNGRSPAGSSIPWLVCLFTHPSSTRARRRVTSRSSSRSPAWSDVVRRRALLDSKDRREVAERVLRVLEVERQTEHHVES